VGYARVKADNCPHKALQTRKDHADYMPHGRQRPTESTQHPALDAAGSRVDGRHNVLDAC
jgi:hypothetical protein